MDAIACSFCGRARDETRKLVAGAGVMICETCVESAEEADRTGQAVATALGRIQRVPEVLAEWPCSFCGKRRHKVAGPSTRLGDASHDNDPSICTECVDLCQEIIAEELR